MPFNAACPECRATYLLADEQKGKKVRCKKCQAVFVAGSPQPRKVNEPLDVEIVPQPPRPRPQPAPSPVTTRRLPPPLPPRDEDRRPRRPERDDFDTPPARGSALPLAIAGIVVGLLLLLGGGIAVVLVMRDSSSGPQPVASTTPPADKPPEAPAPAKPANDPVRHNANLPVDPQPVKPVDPPVKPADPEPARPAPAGEPPAAGNGKIAPEMVQKVKRSTVYLKVTMANGQVASGTGFFGVPEARNVILTNAHVVGMLAPDSRPPRTIEVYVNSGQADERKTTARVLGVDRSSDLAVLDVGATEGMPEPLTVKSATGLVELTEVYTFGFPLGERLGKEITIRPTSVSALRKKNGQLHRIQVNGGMDPGNSGGPVVDGSGNVVGVAVAGIVGTQINFAIPGDRVHTILNGRISALGIGMAYYTDNGRVAFPLNVEMIDPRNRIREVALDVWTGDAPPSGRGYRPAADSQPSPQEGDSQHLRYKIPYSNGSARGDIILPQLPAGKVWWIQPNWVNAAGRSRWASANVWKPPSPPVERKPATLAFRVQPGINRKLTLTGTDTFKLSGEDDDDDAPAVIRTRVEFTENVAGSPQGGALLRLKYQNASRDLIVNKKRIPDPRLTEIRAILPHLQALLRIDALGNVTGNDLDRRSLQLVALQAGQRLQDVVKFHQPIQAALGALSVPLPGKEVQPLETWKAQRPLPINQLNRFEYGRLDLTFTYLGQRNRNGKDEAFIAIDGAAHGPAGKESEFSGKVSGSVLVDLATGQATLTETRVSMDIEVTLIGPDKENPKDAHLLATYVSRLERGM